MRNDISLRPLQPDDAPAFLDAVRESREELSLWADWCTPDYSLEDAQGKIATSLEKRERGEAFDFAVLDAERIFLGCVGISPVDKVMRCGNLGYWIRTSATGKGVATTAAWLLADWCFENTDLERLEIGAQIDNAASQRVAMSVGAQREGILRSRLLVHGEFHDAVLYSIIRSDRRTG